MTSFPRVPLKVPPTLTKRDRIVFRSVKKRVLLIKTVSMTQWLRESAGSRKN